MRVKVPFARHSYTARASTLAPQRLVNMYPETLPPDDKAVVSLNNSPGAKLFQTVGSGPVWGAIELDDLAYIVSGNNVYTLASNTTVTDLGTIGTVSAPVDMAENGLEVAIVNNNTGWIATSSSLTQISDGDFLNASSVTELDGFFIFTETGSDKFFKSAQLDGLTYDGLDFDNADGSSDDLVKAQALQKELVLFGKKTTEFWYNAGGGGFPYQRTNGGFIERGCLARNSVAKEDNTIYLLGDDKIVYRVAGYSLERISTHAIEEDIRKLSKSGIITDAIGFIYTIGGHKFYNLTFPTGNMTLVFDITSGAWHDRESFEIGRWRVNNHVNVFEKDLVGDYVNGNVYELDLDTYTENDDTIQRRLITPVISNNGNSFTIDELVIDAEVGVGITQPAQGSDPEVILRFSVDGGRTWSNDKVKKLGKKGEYVTELKWTNLGFVRKSGIIFQLIISDPVRVSIGEAYAMITEGENA